MSEPNDTQAVFQAVSLCRKAGKLVLGFDAVLDAAMAGKAWVVLTAADASPRTVEKLRRSIGDLVEIHPLPLSQQELCAITRKPVAVYAVSDRNLAILCLQKLEPAAKKEEPSL